LYKAREIFRPKLDDLFDEHGAENVWFQQNGATAHKSRRSLGILRKMFPGHVVSLRGDIGWAPRSPHLTPCDLFLWGYHRAQVYEHCPQTLEGLKEAITQEVVCHSARNNPQGHGKVPGEAQSAYRQ
jgi:hypothetical protein